MCEWRSGFGSVALAALLAFFDETDMDTDEARREFAEASLVNYTFLFADVFEKKGEVRNTSDYHQNTRLILL